MVSTNDVAMFDLVLIIMGCKYLLSLIILVRYIHFYMFKLKKEVLKPPIIIILYAFSINQYSRFHILNSKKQTTLV